MQKREERFLLRLRNARQVVRVAAAGDGLVKKSVAAMNELRIIEHGTLLVGLDGRIADVGPAAEVEARHAGASYEQDVDCTGRCVLPGLCDGHTHAVWAGDRVHEFAMKLAGATYMEIHAKGGGIGFTVEHTRQASEAELLRLLLGRLDRMVRLGTTLVESKSGYGLEAATELKMLRVLHAANAQHPVDIVSNFCGAHSVPRGSTAAEAARDIVERQIPQLVEQRGLGDISPSLIDVFMEKGVFDRATTEQILRAGTKAGLEHNFHGEELSHQGAAELAGELGSLAVSHLECVSDAGIAALAKRPTIAVLLPVTAYILRLAQPPARRMLEAGVPLALGTDFNPNAHCLSMPTVMHMACVSLRLTMPEALCAATLNAAASMGAAQYHGSLEVGKWGDVLVLEADSWEHLIYQMPPPIETVYKKGRPIANMNETNV